jgi:hypothetical protein
MNLFIKANKLFNNDINDPFFFIIIQFYKPVILMKISAILYMEYIFGEKNIS